MLLLLFDFSSYDVSICFVGFICYSRWSGETSLLGCEFVAVGSLPESTVLGWERFHHPDMERPEQQSRWPCEGISLWLGFCIRLILRISICRIRITICSRWSITPIGSTTLSSVVVEKIVSSLFIIRCIDTNFAWTYCVTIYGEPFLFKVISASSDSTVKVWNAHKGFCMSTLRTHRVRKFIHRILVAYFTPNSYFFLLYFTGLCEVLSLRKG